MADANDLLLDTYDRVAESVPAVLDGLSPDDAAWRPDAEGNSIGWLVWHLTRVLDDHLATVSDREQVHTSQGYAGRLGLELPPSDTGWSHSSADVAKVRFADLSALAEYHAAVQAWAAEYLGSVDDLDRVVDERWNPPVTLSARLVSVGDDMARHIGQAEYVRGLLDRR
ncbi:MAG: DinB superfamily protein [Nocardioidaceae bacterium]|nr:DinB superfamily protein [Nocardioidaceae bacterium]